MSVTAGVNDTIIALREKLRGKVGQTKVKRYWPGKAPEWAEEDKGEDVTMHKVVVLDKKDDPRLRRLAKTRTENREQVIAEHRRIRQAEIISTDQEEELNNQETKEEEERRRIKEKNLEREQGEDVEDEDEDEYETDSSEEEMHVHVMIQPFYVQKTERDTIVERKRLEAEEQVYKELAKTKLEMRKIETKQIVVEELKKDEEIQKNMVLEDVETDDETNESEEYEVWRTRDIARLKRERDSREAMLRARVVAVGLNGPNIINYKINEN